MSKYNNVDKTPRLNDAEKAGLIGDKHLYGVSAQQAIANHPRINHKVEQIVRAVVLGFTPAFNRAGQPLPKGRVQAGILNISCQTTPLICQYDPEELVCIGKADARGYRFNPESNSALIVLGLHPSAFLFHLTTFKRNGVPVVRELDDGSLACEFGALVQCARNAVFQWETKEVIDGKLQRRKPILEHYILAGKPASFA